MAKKNKIKPDKNFRKESRRQENKMYALIGVAAVALAVLIAMINKIDFMSCSNTGASTSEIIENQESAESNEDTTQE